MIGLASTAYVKQVLLDGRPASAGSVVLAAGSELQAAGSVDLVAGSELEIVVATDSGTITGVVTEQRAIPVQTVICALLLSDHSQPPYAFDKVFYTDTNGSFRVEGVPPGSYKLFFWKNQDEFSCLDPSLLQTSQAQALRLRVDAGTTSTVNAQIIQI